ncbi:hypothetical protein QCA50_000539 [Cerrena zonata]|uniref:Uncharacterized protein n=1 Tax=Cerrena zonata TaxID=2478898 RepID=A0AAW0GXD4_9APHY
MNEDSFSDHSYDATDPRRDSTDMYQSMQQPIGLRPLTRQGPPSDDASNPGNEFIHDYLSNNAHIVDLKAPTALRSFAGFHNRTQMQMPSSGTPQPPSRLLQNKLALKGPTTHLRSGKSLQQRLNANQRTDEDSEAQSHSFARESGFRLSTSTPHRLDSQMPRLPRSHTPRVDHMMPINQSRSMSVVSSATANDEDISSLMIRGATDLRSAKFELKSRYIFLKISKRIDLIAA